MLQLEIVCKKNVTLYICTPESLPMTSNRQYQNIIDLLQVCKKIDAIENNLVIYASKILCKCKVIYF